jgi:hypothetical protein
MVEYGFSQSSVEWVSGMEIGLSFRTDMKMSSPLSQMLVR